MTKTVCLTEGDDDNDVPDASVDNLVTAEQKNNKEDIGSRI